MMGSSNQAVHILKGVRFLAGLDQTTLEEIARAANRRHYEPGELVLLEGEPCLGLYLIERGWLKAVKTGLSGREQIMRFAGPGDAFNEVGCVAESPNLVTVIALEPAVIWMIPRESMIELMDERPGFARVIAQNLAERTLRMIRLVEDLSLRTVEARLSRALLEQATGDAVERQPWTTQAQMAAQIGTVPDVLNRALRNLADANLVTVERRKIKILDRPGLEQRAEPRA